MKIRGIRLFRNLEGTKSSIILDQTQKKKKLFKEPRAFSKIKRGIRFDNLKMSKRLRTKGFTNQDGTILKWVETTEDV